MANNWQPPSASSAGWVPSGKGLRALMGGLVKGSAAWRERKDEYAAQQLAVQQYEEEKEYKRKQDEYKRTQDQINAALEARRVEQEAIATQANLKYEYELRKELKQMDIDAKKKEDELTDYRGEIEEIISTAQTKVQTPVGKRLLTTADVAFRRGDYGKLAEIYNQIDKIDEQGLLMIMEEVEATEKGGVPTTKKKPSDDYGYLKSTIGKMMYNLEKMTGQRPQAGVGQVSPQGRITVKSLLKQAIESGDAKAVSQLQRMYGKAMESDPRTGETKALIDVLLDELEAEGVKAQR